MLIIPPIYHRSFSKTIDIGGGGIFQVFRGSEDILVKNQAFSK